MPIYDIHTTYYILIYRNIGKGKSSSIPSIGPVNHINSRRNAILRIRDDF